MSTDRPPPKDQKYYCQQLNCEFHEGNPSDKYFKRKLLRDQHMANKHYEKEFRCPTCEKAYAFGWQLSHHQKSCGLIWSCLSCDKTYSERLSLVVHCKRHKHTLPDSADFKKNRKSKYDKHKKPTSLTSDGCASPKEKTTVIIVPIFVNNPSATIGRTILPKTGEVNPVLSSSSTQTLPVDSSCANCSTASKQRFRCSTQTQTLQEDKMKGKASTSAQCPPVRTIRSKRKKQDPKLIKESIETQTLESTLISSSSNEVINKRTVRKPSTSVSIGVDTTEPVVGGQAEVLMTDQPFSLAASTEMSVQTEEVPLTLGYSTTETQTMGSEQELLSIFNNLENGDENDLFFELDMNDIETQTNWNEMDSTTQTDASTCIDDFLSNYMF